jgi:beta-N-acetylhexosaminidase
VKDAANVTPIASGRRVLSVTVARRPDLLAGTTFDATLRSAGSRVRSAYVDADAGTPADYAAVRALADSVDVVVVGSYVSTRWDAATIGQSQSFIAFMRALRASGKPVMLVAFGNPYLLQQVPEVQGYAVAWTGIAAAQAAAARGLAGRAQIVGRLPISIPPLAVRGAGMTRR